MMELQTLFEIKVFLYPFKLNSCERKGVLVGRFSIPLPKSASISSSHILTPERSN